MSGTIRRANDDEFAELPPLSDPPGAIEAPLREMKRRPPAVAAPRGIPQPDPSRVTFTEEVVLNNKFRLLRLMGMREEELVYQALHTGTGRRVELHMLPSGLPADGPAGQRMLRAARAAGRVPHLSVLSVVDSGTDQEGRPFLVYEHFTPTNCAQYVEEHGPFSVHATAEIMVQLLDALHAMHDRGVLHRQIRPENVLIDVEGNAPRIKLTGFSHAVAGGKNTQIPELPKGYSRYMAPEVRRGTAVAAPSVDIYAAGVFMRFLMTGDTDPHVNLDYRAARSIQRATADDPDERFRSAEQFLSAVTLMQPEDGRPDSLVPPDPLAADLKYMQQRRDRESGVTVTPTGEGKLNLYPVLMMIEAIYARIGGDGWRRLIAEVPHAEQLLPAAGRGEELRVSGVPVALVARMLSAADAIGGKGDLGSLASVGEAMVKRGVNRFCPQLPKHLTPSVIVDCLPVLWSSLSRQGEVVVMERLDESARVAIRAQVEPCLEVSAVMAGLLRALLRGTASKAEVNTVASQALGDPADIYVLSFG